MTAAANFIRGNVENTPKHVPVHPAAGGLWLMGEERGLGDTSKAPCPRPLPKRGLINSRGGSIAAMAPAAGGEAAHARDQASHLQEQEIRRFRLSFGEKRGMFLWESVPVRPLQGAFN